MKLGLVIVVPKEDAMPENIWEELVQTYLTTNRAILVSPQYEIADEQGWKIYPDFLAIDFRASQIWLVEVTAGWSTSKIEGKANKFKAEIVPRLRSQLIEFKITTDASNWQFGLWAFVRKDVAKRLRDKITSHVDFVKVQDLESMAFPWTYWDKRRSEESPLDH